MAYTTPGRQTSGIWLVQSPKGKLSFHDRSNLPTGQGYEYYWLGASYGQASSRLQGAVDALKPPGGITGFDESLPLFGGINKSILNTIQGPFTTKNISKLDQQLQQAFSTGSSPAAQPQQQAPNPITSGLGGGLFGGAASVITDTTSFLQWIAWIFAPINLLRAVEFLVGLALMGFGVHAGAQAYQEARGGGQLRDTLSRSGIGRVAARTPAGRVAEGARQRRAGRRSERASAGTRRRNEQYRRGQTSEAKRQRARSDKRVARGARRRARGPAGDDVPF